MNEDPGDAQAYVELDTMRWWEIDLRSGARMRIFASAIDLQRGNYVFYASLGGPSEWLMPVAVVPGEIVDVGWFGRIPK